MEMFRLFSQSPLVHSLEQTKADLMESMGESRKRKDEIEVSCYQGGRSCTGAQVAPAEKFGLGRKF